jgi:hypothetical protein
MTQVAIATHRSIAHACVDVKQLAGNRRAFTRALA